MNSQDRLSLLAEQKFLREQLDALPASARLTRMSTESRLREIERQMAQEPVQEPEPARVRLTFNGRPVIGSHGIFADFGMKAVSCFSDAVTTLAASLLGPLAPSGPIPNREQHQLLVVGTAVGSFGFELEEYLGGQLLFDEVSLVAQALEQTRNLLSGTLGTDEELADSAAETDPRALDRIRGFLQVLAENEAVCTLQYRERAVKFSDIGQVKTSLARLGQDNLRESEESLEGEFRGVLPKSRTFEFLLAGAGGEIIKGKVGAAIQAIDSLNQHLNEPVRLTVMTTRVGNGRPRYVLQKLPSWQKIESTEN